MPFFPRRKTAWVGLGLHHEHLSLIKMQCVKQTFQIENFLLTPLPNNSISDGTIHAPAQLEAQIANLVTMSEARHCPAVLSFPFTQVINRRIRMAAFLSDEERFNEMAADLAAYFPGMQDELYFDYAPLSADSADEEMLLVAARAKQINAFAAAAESAGLQVRIMDVDVYAYVRAINFIYGKTAEKICFIDAALSQLIILQHGIIVFSHPVVFESLEDILQSIKKIFQIYSPLDAQVKKIRLSGKFAIIEKLTAALTEWLKIDVEWVNPLSSSQLMTTMKLPDLQNKINEALVTLGLGLRGCLHG